MKPVRKAIIPAAGYGTRFLPATKSQPKEMLCIIDKPVLQFVVEEAFNSGITDILIILSKNKESIINHFDKNLDLEELLIQKNKLKELEEIKKLDRLGNIFFTRQDQPKGLGHAISLGQSFVGDEPFAVLLGDDLINSKKPVTKQLIETYQEVNSPVLGIQPVDEESVSNYGILDGDLIREGLLKVNSLVEKPEITKAPSNLAILGRYILTPEIFKVLKTIQKDRYNEIQLTDGLVELLSTDSIYGRVFEGKRYDIGSKLGYIKATIDMALETDEFRIETEEYIRQVLNRL